MAPSQVDPPQTVVVFGGAGSLVVGLVYVPAANALRRRARLLCDELFDLRCSADADALLTRLDERHRLEVLLGADAGAFSDLQSGLVVLAPLLASAAALLVPH